MKYCTKSRLREGSERNSFLEHAEGIADGDEKKKIEKIGGICGKEGMRDDFVNGIE